MFRETDLSNKVKLSKPKAHVPMDNKSSLSYLINYFHLDSRSELLGQFRLIGDRASDVSGGRICLTQNAYAEI